MNAELFTDISQIKGLIKRADDKGITRNLINKFVELQKIRIPFYLTLDDFDEILHWKLRKQYRRQLKFRERNTDQNVQIITKAAFEIKHHNSDIETELKIKVLTALSGVEIPVASAILALCNPNLYSVIDVRNWRQIYSGVTQKTSYSIKEYNDYLKIIRELADKFSLTPQEIDVAIWQFDREINSTPSVKKSF